MNPADKSARITQIYSELDRKFEEEETQRKAKRLKLAYINLSTFPIDLVSLDLIPLPAAKSAGAILFFKEGRNIKIGLMDQTPTAQALLADLKKEGYTIEIFLISKSSYQAGIDSYSKVMHVAPRSNEIKIDVSNKKLSVKSLDDLAQQLGSVSATQLIDTIFGAALTMEASDIHLEPDTNGLKVRYRLDGVLQDAARLTKDAYHLLLSRIKILSKLKLNVANVPQDGSFSLTYNSVHIDVRVSVLPSAFGESIVMRILRQDKGSLDFNELGISGLALERILKEIEKPNGMILTTGPTGSGKTTTLYAILKQLNEPGVKIITLEDPVEYKLAGITQTPIDVGSGLTFATGLRAILRQDPDVVMVGEMRDLETAETATQAALTGHIVLSTLHTNDAAGAIPRLLDLGVKPFVLAPAINAIIAQRLVRKICTYCKTTYAPAPKILEHISLILKAISPAAKVKVPKDLTFYHSPGCDKCNGLGYKGRVGVYEIFTINEAIEKLIHKEATTTEIFNQAVLDGMVTMAQDGILKALEGITDVEEVFRVTEE